MRKLFEKEFKVETNLSVEQIVQRLNDIRLTSKKQFSDLTTFVNAYVHGYVTGDINNQGFAISLFLNFGTSRPALAKGRFIENTDKTVILVKVVPVRGQMFLYWSFLFIAVMISLLSLREALECGSLYCKEILPVFAPFILRYLLIIDFHFAEENIKKMFNDVLEAREINSTKQKS